jgi:hypothetical protein
MNPRPNAGTEKMKPKIFQPAMTAADALRGVAG